MVSIIVPIYNVESYLNQCVDSLINQTYEDIEVILVDDGSPDQCSKICDDYLKKDNRIVVIHQKNAGVSEARNAGLRVAKGQYIAFVDPDDWVAPDMYNIMMQTMQQYQMDLVVCGYEYCHEDGCVDEQRKYQEKETVFLSQKEIMKRMSDIPPSIRHSVCNKLFSARLLENILFPRDLHSSEDVWFLTEYITRIKKAAIIHKPLYFNRIRNGSATHGGLSIHSLSESYKAHRFMYENIVNEYPDLKDYSQAFLLDVYLLKYKMAKKKTETEKITSEKDFTDLAEMRRAIHNEGIYALFNRNIYWKTKMNYLIVK